MSVRPKAPPLRLAQRRLFLAQFEKDLEFFKLFFLVMNKSRMIRHMGVLWARDGPAAQVGLPSVVGTEHALQIPCSRYVQCDPELDPDFCRIINDDGRHEAESCGRSDAAAEKRCRRTGETQIYTCHAGLVDIAVPVVSDGQYIGTLLCGQVLAEAPSVAGFEKVRRKVARLGYIQIEKLEAAYRKVPVSSAADIQNIVRLLEAFAGYLATSWGRLAELVQEQNRSIRESQLLRKEFAHLVLDGTLVDRSSLAELMTKLELYEAPNRVLVVRLDPEEHCAEGAASSDVRFTAALQAIEEICETRKNTVAAYLRKRGISVFLHDRGADAHRAHELAARMLESVRETCGLGARVGIGGRADDAHALVRSYDEACMALAQSLDAVAVYRKPVAPMPDLAQAAERVCTYLTARKLAEARLAVEALWTLAEQRLGRATLRQFLCSTLYSMCFCARQLGADREALDQTLWKVDGEIHGAPGLPELRESLLRAAGVILDEVRRLYSTRKDKLVERACRLVDPLIEQRDERITSSRVAGILRVSTSHLGRTFRQVTGGTFERFVMTRRVEFGKQLLLNPAYNVSLAAERCGFADPAYFARVFRQIARCSPREYMRDPLRYDASRDAATPVAPCPQ